jgi:hypothetical protein
LKEKKDRKEKQEKKEKKETKAKKEKKDTKEKKEEADKRPKGGRDDKDTSDWSQDDDAKWDELFGDMDAGAIGEGRVANGSPATRLQNRLWTMADAALARGDTAACFAAFCSFYIDLQLLFGLLKSCPLFFWP